MCDCWSGHDESGLDHEHFVYLVSFGVGDRESRMMDALGTSFERVTLNICKVIRGAEIVCAEVALDVL